MIMVIINDSNSRLSVAASFFPPCTPIVMFLRMGVGDSTGMAIRRLHRSYAPQHLGCTLVFRTDVPRRYPHVRKACHAARNSALDPLQLTAA